MDVRKAIERRRSVRVFDYERQVSDQDLATILGAARRAPSWKNEQPWRFVAVRSSETRRKILAALTEDNPARGAVAEASVVIVVLGVPEEGEIHQGKPFYLVDCGIAGQNLFLQAVELVSDRQTKVPLEPAGVVGGFVRDFCYQRGMILRNNGDILVLAPPLIVTEGIIDELVGNIEAAVVAALSAPEIRPLIAAS